MLGLWGASLIPAIKVINDPRGDPFELIPAFWATITLLPLGLTALIGCISGGAASVWRARTSLFIAGGLFVVVLLLEALRRVSMMMDG